MASSRNTSRLLTGAFTTLVASAALTLAGCSQAAPEPAANDSNGSASIAPPTIIKEGALTVCTGDSPPNIYYDENNELIGVEIDLANALADNLGLDTTLAEYAFSGLIPALQAKQCDVIMGSLYIKPEREEIANFVPYLYSGTGVGVAKENPRNITGNDDSLCGLKIVAITGATGASAAEARSEACEEAGKDPLNITLIDEGATAVQQVLTGQQDAFIDTSEIMGFYGQQSDGAIVLIGDVSDKVRIGAATLKENTELNEALATAFETMVDDGTYHAILEEWDVAGNDITQAD